MFRFVFLSVCLFVWINQSNAGIEPMIKLEAGPVTKVFSPGTTTTGETTATSTRETVGTTTVGPTPPSQTPYLDKLNKEVIDFFRFTLSSFNDAIAKEQDVLDAKIVKVLTSLETQRRALVKLIRNFGFSTVLDTDTRFAIADKVSGTINCMKSAELELEYLPIGITGDFSAPAVAAEEPEPEFRQGPSFITFEEGLLSNFAGYVGDILFGELPSRGETCARLMDLTYAKLNSKLGPSSNVLKKCTSNFTSVNVEDIKDFEARAALALKQVDTLVKAVSSCKWTVSKGIETCAKNIIRVADATSICDDTTALSPMLGSMLTASYSAITNCVINAGLSGVAESAIISLRAEIISKCGSAGRSLSRMSDVSDADGPLSVGRVNTTHSVLGNRKSAGLLNFYVKKYNMNRINLN